MFIVAEFRERHAIHNEMKGRTKDSILTATTTNEVEK